MSTVYLTGATGLIGSNIAKLLLESGHHVRGLVRNPKSRDGTAIRAAGVEVVAGDITDLESVLATAEGCDALIHSAAMLGGPYSSMEEGFAVNIVGTINVLSAAARLDISPVVQLTTTTFFDMWTESLTETSPLDLRARNLDSYSLTKRVAYIEGAARAAEGQDIRFIIPGGAFGPTPCLDRAMILPSFDATIVSAIKGEIESYPAMPIPWVWVDDVAYVCVAALERGRPGERYIAMGRQEDVGPLSFFCNTACEVAGVPHRVENLLPDDPGIAEKFGQTWADIVNTPFPEPWFDHTVTRERLDYRPIAMVDALERTIKWMRDIALIDA
jgi:nucleoside-diphosphate-sugar epimerase